jgi:nuclear GTP-binding protein
VKSHYLTRTYGLTVPGAGSWAADDFLDTLARAKGRLLKGGEPDLEGAAKVVLSDWVRGRIPYFVVPPERSAELNEREAKERARLTKSKAGDSLEEKRVPGVKQNLGSIMQKNTFVGEDLRSLEGIDLEGDGEDMHAEEEGIDGAASDGDDGEAEDEAPLVWGDVFVEERAIVPSKTAGSGAEDEEEEEWSGITSHHEEGAQAWNPSHFQLTDVLPSDGTFRQRVRRVYDARERNTYDNQQGKGQRGVSYVGLTILFSPC